MKRHYFRDRTYDRLTLTDQCVTVRKVLFLQLYNLNTQYYLNNVSKLKINISILFAF